MEHNVDGYGKWANHPATMKGFDHLLLEWILKSNFILKQEITWDMGKSANCDKIRFFPFSERIYWLTKNSKVKLLNKNSLSDVWRLVPTHKRGEEGHIAVMPDGIVQNIIDALPNIPNVCYDPFAGTGTTCKIAKQNGINYIGSELEKQSYDVAINNLNSKLF